MEKRRERRDVTSAIYLRMMILLMALSLYVTSADLAMMNVTTVMNRDVEKQKNKKKGVKHTRRGTLQKNWGRW